MKKSQFHFIIITPSYNQATFLPQTIQSIISQITAEDYYLVMDGASTDGSIQILRRFAHQLTFISKPDRGQADALNKGLEQARAWLATNKISAEKSIFAYLNSDDYYLPSTLSQVRQFFSEYPDTTWLVGDCQIVNEKGQIIQSWVQKYKRFFRQILSWPLLFILNPLPQPAVFVRGDMIEQLHGFNSQLRYALDYDLWLRLWQIARKPVQIKETIAAFRIHAASKGKLQYQQQFAEQLKVAQQLCPSWPWLLLQRLHNKLIISCYHFFK